MIADVIGLLLKAVCSGCPTPQRDATPSGSPAASVSRTHTHSIEYKEKENISLEEIFSEIGSIERSKFSEPSQIQSNWAIDIARNKEIIGQKPRFSFDNNKLEIREVSSKSPDFVRSVSNKIDKFGETLKRILDE
ncbi:hypothetical protein R6Q57_019098 [Mikania cordata]